MRTLAFVFVLTMLTASAVHADDAKLREEIGILRAEKQALEEKLRKLTADLEKAQRVEAELTKLRAELARGFNDMSERIARLEGAPVRVTTKPEVNPKDDPFTKSLAKNDPPTTPLTTPAITTNPKTTTPTTTGPALKTPTIVKPDLPRIPDVVIPTTPTRTRPKEDRPHGTPTTIAMVDMVQLWDALKEKKAIEDGLSDLIYAVQFADQNWQKKIRELELDQSLLAVNSEAWLEKRRQIEASYIERNVAIASAKTKLNRRRGELTKALYAKMVHAIGRVAEENGYDGVIFKEPEPQFGKLTTMNQLYTDRMVIVGTDSVDLTDQAIRLMNREYEK